MPTGTEPIAIVIVSYNTREHLRRCLRTVMPEASGLVVVADNGSTDGSAEMVSTEFPAVVLDVDPSNPGYGAAANRAIRRCGGADVLLLNSDTELSRGCVGTLAQYLGAHPRAGVIGPRLIGPGGELQRSCFPFPSGTRPMPNVDPLATVLQYVPGLRRHYLPTWPHDSARTVPWVLGAALLIRRAAFDAVGGFDESYFMYFEEVDLCYRMRQAGWETHYAPVAEVRHTGGASTEQLRGKMLAQLFGSTFHFYRQHYSGLKLAFADTSLKTVITLRLLRDLARQGHIRDQRRLAHVRENVEIWRDLLAHGGPPAAVGTRPRPRQ